MTWYLYALIPMVLYTIYNLGSSVLLKNSSDTKAFAVVFYGLTAIFTFGIAFYETFSIPQNLSVFSILITLFALLIWGYLHF